MTRKERRYATNPEYRARTLAAAKAYHEANKSSATYRELIKARKHIVSRRDGINAYLNKLEKLEADLKRLIKRRDMLADKFRAERAH